MKLCWNVITGKDYHTHIMIDEDGTTFGRFLHYEDSFLDTVNELIVTNKLAEFDNKTADDTIRYIRDLLVYNGIHPSHTYRVELDVLAFFFNVTEKEKKVYSEKIKAENKLEAETMAKFIKDNCRKL